MTFLQPLALVSLISIPIILLMYMLRQKYRQQAVPSLFLWRLAAEMSRAERPWQRLRRSLLMFLQILAAFLICAALASPFWKNADFADNYILVIDTSLSMSATDEPDGRISEAKRLAAELAASVKKGSNIAVVSMSQSPSIVCNFTDDRSLAQNRINSLEATNGGVHAELCAGLVDALLAQRSAAVYLFSDGEYQVADKYELIRLGKSPGNLGITLVSSVAESNRTVALVKVKNYSGEAAETSVSLYVDNVLHDMRDLSLAPDEEKDIFFTEAPVGERLHATLSPTDLLAADDVFYHTVSRQTRERAVLVTDGNVFLETMLGLLPGIELSKAQPQDIGSLSGYYLYVFDGVLPEQMPTDGHVWLLNPPEGNSFIETGAAEPVSGIYQSGSPLVEFLGGLDFSVSMAKNITAPPWLETIIRSPELPLVMAGGQNGRKVLVMSFDLHHSNLPLKKEFPVFVYNAVSWFAPAGGSGEGFFSESPAVLPLSPGASEITVISPDNRVMRLAPPFPAPAYSDAREPGFYTLEQLVGGERLYTAFAVNAVRTESDLRATSGQSSSGAQQTTLTGASINKSLRPIVLGLALAVLAAEYFVYIRSQKRRPHGFLIAVRVLLMTLALAALLNPNIKFYTKATSTIVALDMSRSMDVPSAWDFVSEADLERGANDLAGLLAFGENAVPVQMPGAGPLTYPQAVPRPGYTNIETTLKIALSMLPEQSRKRILLVSDGLENAGRSAADEARLLKERGVVIDSYYVENSISAEVQLDELNLPKKMKENAAYDMEVVGYALAETGAQLRIFKNDSLIVNERVLFRSGENIFVFTDYARDSGGVLYRAEILPDTDTFAENNTAYAFSYVEGAVRALVLDFEGSGAELEKLLLASGALAERIDAAAAPAAAERLNNYDQIILADVPIDAMPESLPELLKSYVSDGGGGLVVTGGENSYALGGYIGTPLEEALPVEMTIEDKSQKPDLSMIMVIDRSGSMGMGQYGVSKLGMAKEAVIRSLDAMSDDDKLGILAFDDSPHWVSKFGPLNRQQAADNAASISLGGGTSILPALEEAFKVLSTGDTKLKHIILLTDGQAEQTGYNQLVAAMAAQGITLSTVAVGSDADTALLSWLAENGGGRYYFTDEFSDLPKIFATETMLAGRNYINEEAFYPLIGDLTGILAGVSSVPELGGYISTTAKARADVPLLSGRDEPVLAAWQYGLGRAAAWTSDANGRWSGAWLQSAEGVTVFRNMLSWTVRSQMNTDISLDAELSGRGALLTLTMPFDDGAAEVVATVGGEQLVLNAVAPGRYTGELDSASGAQIVHIGVRRDDGSVDTFTTGFRLGYSPEYDIRSYAGGREKLALLTELTGGQILTAPEDAYYELPQTAYREQPLADFLLWAVLVVLLMDIAIRRFPAVMARLSRVFRAVSAPRTAKPGVLRKKPDAASPGAQADNLNDAVKPGTENAEAKSYTAGDKNAKPASGSSSAPLSQRLLSQKKKRGG